MTDEALRALIARWREKEQALCRQADNERSQWFARIVAARADGFGTCAFELEDELEAAVLTGPLPQGWQPIETAPKDYRVSILVYDKSWCGGNPRITATHWVRYRDGNGDVVVEKGSFLGVSKPTHWMPLPAAPGVLTGAPRQETVTGRKPSEPHLQNIPPPETPLGKEVKKRFR